MSFDLTAEQSFLDKIREEFKGCIASCFVNHSVVYSIIIPTRRSKIPQQHVKDFAPDFPVPGRPEAVSFQVIRPWGTIGFAISVGINTNILGQEDTIISEDEVLECFRNFYSRYFDDSILSFFPY